MELWERIARARKAAGLSQEELGNRLSVSRQAVSKWETNQTKPDVDTIIRMCQVLDLSADYLLFGKEDGAPSQPAGPDPSDAPPASEDEASLRGRKYAILLIEPAPTVFSSAQNLIMECRDCSPDVAYAMLENAPTVLLRDLSLDDAKAALKTLLDCGYAAAAIDTVHSDTVEEALDAPQITLLLETEPSDAPKEPMSFGMTVLAVALGVVVALFFMALF